MNGYVMDIDGLFVFSINHQGQWGRGTRELHCPRGAFLKNGGKWLTVVFGEVDCGIYGIPW